MIRYFKNYLHIGIAIVLSFLILLLIHPSGNLTQEGVKALAICIPTIYLWITVSMTWPSLLAVVLICFSGVYDNISQVSSVSLGNQSTFFFLVCMIFSFILIENGTIGRCADFFLSRRISAGRPYMFMFMFFLSITIVVCFLEKNAVTIVACTLIHELMIKMNVREHSEYANAMYVGTLLVTSIAGNSTPISHLIPVIMMRLIPVEISLFQWCTAGFFMNIAMLTVTMFVIRFIWRPVEKDGFIMGEYISSLNPASRKEKITIAVLITVVILWLMPEFIKGSAAEGIITIFKKSGDIGPVVIGIIILCIIHINGKPAADINAAISKVPLRLTVFQCGVYLMSDVISSEKTGIRDTLYGMIYPLVKNIHPFLILVVLIILAVVMTNLTSNVIVAVLFTELSYALFSGTSYPLFVVIFLVSQAVCLAMLTPNASLQTALIYDPAYVRLKDVWRYALIMAVFMMIVLAAAVMPMMMVWR